MKKIIGYVQKTIAYRRFVRWYKLQTMALRWQRKLAPAAVGGKRILCATSIGSYLPAVYTESLLAAAMTVHGAKVDALLCDGVLPACFDCMLDNTITEKELVSGEMHRHLCAGCRASGRKTYESLGIDITMYGSLLDSEIRRRAHDEAMLVDLAELKQYHYRDIPVGEHALAGVLRFYARGTLEMTAPQQAILRRFTEAGILTAEVMLRLFDRVRYDAVVTHHGIYSPMGIVAAVCRSRGIELVTWNPAYRKNCFIFSRGETYHHTLMTEPVSQWEKMTFGSKEEQHIDEYLKSRWYGSKDWIWFHEKPFFDIAAIEKEIGIDFKVKPTVAILTNVFWDAQLHYPENVFADMREWLIETIRYFGTRSDVQAVVRIHPAEVRGTVPSRQLMDDEIKKVFPTLPQNVFVVGPTSDVSTYALAEQCDAAVIYGTKTGVELTAMGIPVIVAGEAWIKNKEITIDPKDKASYFAALATLPFGRRLSADIVQRAKKYAYHFFFRRMIPIPEFCLSQKKFKSTPYVVRSCDPGALRDISEGLRTVCDGILDEGAFVYTAGDDYSEG